MPFKKPRERILPNNIHYWRGKKWREIQIIEATPGDGLRRSKGINRVVQVFNKRLIKGQLSQKQTYNAARAIQILASEITDEAIQRMDQNSMKHGSWNEEYINCLKHYWQIMPRKLKAELIRQSRKE